LDRRVLAPLLVALALLGGCSDEGRGNGLQAVNAERLSPRLVELELSTPSLNEEAGVRVLLPRGYGRNKRRYPVLYLLHGAGGSYSTWTDFGAAARITKPYPMIVVMPDGGTDGFYSDWHNDGEGGPPKWETFHIGELIPWIDSRFRTKATRRQRAIAGVSMGGFGSLSYAARHPQVFGVAASFSGAVDTNYEPIQQAIEAVRTDGGEPAIWGPYASEQQRWREHNPWDIAGGLRSVRVLLFTGNGQPGGQYGGGPDAMEAHIEQMNLRLHQRLNELGIAHYFNDYGPGTHNLQYAGRDLVQTLPYLVKYFSKRRPKPGAGIKRP
jgi:S-formylglutathione hydrolase FrmB